MLQDPTFWVAVAFLCFVVLAARPVSRALTGALDARSSRIRNELDEAQALREEAQKTVAEFKRKQRDALKEAELILDHAKIEAKRLAERAEQDLEAALERREQAALDKIAQAEAQALQEVRDQAIDVALMATAKLLADNLGPERSGAIIDRAIRDLPGKLH
jgi:F-type H+-transporting ATPase subunit b